MNPVSDQGTPHDIQPQESKQTTDGEIGDLVETIFEGVSYEIIAQPIRRVTLIKEAPQKIQWTAGRIALFVFLLIFGAIAGGLAYRSHLLESSSKMNIAKNILENRDPKESVDIDSANQFDKIVGQKKFTLSINGKNIESKTEADQELEKFFGSPIPKEHSLSDPISIAKNYAYTTSYTPTPEQMLQLSDHGLYAIPEEGGTITFPMRDENSPSDRFTFVADSTLSIRKSPATHVNEVEYGKYAVHQEYTIIKGNPCKVEVKRTFTEIKSDNAEKTNAAKELLVGDKTTYTSADKLQEMRSKINYFYSAFEEKKFSLFSGGKEVKTEKDAHAALGTFFDQYEEKDGISNADPICVAKTLISGNLLAEDQIEQLRKKGLEAIPDEPNQVRLIESEKESFTFAVENTMTIRKSPYDGGEEAYGQYDVRVEYTISHRIGSTAPCQIEIKRTITPI